MDLEKGSIEAVSGRIKHFIDREKGRDEHVHNPISFFTGYIPSTIDSLIPPRPSRKHFSLGPCHLDQDRHVDIKASYMCDLFKRLKSPPDEIGTECVNRVYAKFDRIIACYTGSLYNIDGSSIQCGMVIDACYILELIQKWSEAFMYHRRQRRDKSSPVRLELKHDLVRVDNQIPFFVLQDIFECTIMKIQPTTPSLPKLILAFLNDIIPFEANEVIPDHDDPNNYKHILDLVYQCYMPEVATRLVIDSGVTTMFSGSVTKLAKAGVKFNPNPDDKWKLDMKFTSSWGNATLKMPVMRIEESTACVLCNLAAYERVFPEVGDYITSYVFGMKMLLDTKDDVLKLVESNIFKNPTGHQYVVDLIHGLCEDITLITNFSYAIPWIRMGKYYNGWLGSTRRTYFSGAWSYIASISGLILFFLTVVQTYCSIRTI